MKETKVTSMTEAEIQTATAALVELRRHMTFMLPMTATERLAIRKLGKRAVQATQMRAAAARDRRDVLPPSFDLRAFEREVALMTALESCLTAANQLQSDLRDTFLIVGTGALQTSKVAFGYIQVATQAGDDDAHRTVKHLKLRTRKPKREPPAPAPATKAEAGPSGPASQPVAPGAAGAAGSAESPSGAPPSPQLAIVRSPASTEASSRDKVA